MAIDVDQKLLKQTKFPTEFNQKVDMQKVNLEVMKKWIAGKISDILGNEDDVVIELCFNLLEESRFPKIKDLQIQLGGFLGQPTAGFCKELWSLCLSAQSNPQGVPKELLEAKKLELIQEKIQAEKAAEAAQRRKEEETVKENELDSTRQRERAERGGERGHGRSRGRDRGGRASVDPRPHGAKFDRSDAKDRRRDNSSPPPNRRGMGGYRGNLSRREMDTYVPSNRHKRSDSRPRRLRSPSPSNSRYRSSSRSPRRGHRSYRDLSRSTSPLPRDASLRGADSYTSNRKRSGSRRRRRSSPHLGRRPYERSHRRQDRRSRSPSSKDTRRRERSFSSSSRSPPVRRRRRMSSYSRSPQRSEDLPLSRSLSPHKAARKHKRPTSTGDNRNESHDERTDSYRERARSRQQFRSISPQSERKRRRSIERYEPLAKRRRTTSSGSSEIPRKAEPAGSNEEERPTVLSSDLTRKREYQLREKVLRERLLAQRNKTAVLAGDAPNLKTPDEGSEKI